LFEKPPLHLNEGDRLSVIKFLLENGANPNVQNPIRDGPFKNEPAILYCVRCDGPEIVRLFHKYEATLQDRDWKAIGRFWDHFAFKKESDVLLEIRNIAAKSSNERSDKASQQVSTLAKGIMAITATLSGYAPFARQLITRPPRYCATSSLFISVSANTYTILNKNPADL
jgi:hypothetical protein